MALVSLHDKTEIEIFLRKNPGIHLYSLGDLDSFFWSFTTWYGFRSEKELEAIILLYSGFEIPTLLVLSEADNRYIRLLLSQALSLLPRRFYLHINPGLEEELTKFYNLKNFGRHYKMVLENQQAVKNIDTGPVQKLGEENLDQLLQLYNRYYPGNWFDARMLQTGQYYGIFEEKKLVSVAGIHVFSPEYRAAALGNILTHPEHRGKGYGTTVTAAVCRSLQNSGIVLTGLNVRQDNLSAIWCYEKLGFKIAAAYDEFEAIISF